MKTKELLRLWRIGLSIARESVKAFFSVVKDYLIGGQSETRWQARRGWPQSQVRVTQKFSESTIGKLKLTNNRRGGLRNNALFCFGRSVNMLNDSKEDRVRDLHSILNTKCNGLEETCCGLSNADPGFRLSQEDIEYIEESVTAIQKAVSEYKLLMP